VLSLSWLDLFGARCLKPLRHERFRATSFLLWKCKPPRRFNVQGIAVSGLFTAGDTPPSLLSNIRRRGMRHEMKASDYCADRRSFDFMPNRDTTRPGIAIRREDPLIYSYMHEALRPCLQQVTNAVIPKAGHGMFRANPKYSTNV